MRKAIITGFVTGIMISTILIGVTFLRPLLPYTFTANLFFMSLFFLSIVGVLWLSLSFYCRSSEVKWMTLSLTGAVSSVIAAVVVSAFGTAMYRFLDLAVLLFLLSVVIAAVYYAVNRNRHQQAVGKNHELIF